MTQDDRGLSADFPAASEAQWRQSVERALKGSAFSRERIAQALSAAVGKEITKAVLDSWRAESKPGHRLPASYIPALTLILGNCEIISLLSEQAGGRFLPGGETLRLELEQIESEKGRLRDRERVVRDLLEALQKDGQTRK